MIGPAHETHPLFADRPELDALAFAVVFALHKQVPEDERPTSWSNFTEAQVLRAKEAAALAYDAAIEEAATRIGSLKSDLITKEGRAIRNAYIAAQDVVLAMRKRDPRDEDPFFPGIFRANTCGYCSDGRLPCKEGAPHRCGRPRARND